MGARLLRRAKLYKYLTGKGFQGRTLDMLNDINLQLLANDYRRAERENRRAEKCL